MNIPKDERTPGLKFWFDTEFIEDGHTIDLMSIGVVCEDGREYYAEIEECDLSRADDWVKANVIVHLTGEKKPRAVVRDELLAFMGVKPEIWAYYADYDWIALCQLFGRMIDLPEGWPMFCRDLKQLAENTPLLKQQGTEHHALADARWTREAWIILNRSFNSLREALAGLLNCVDGVHDTEQLEVKSFGEVIEIRDGEDRTHDPDTFYNDEDAEDALKVTDRQTSDDVGRLREALTELLNVPELADIDPEDRSEECWEAERKARAALKGVPQPASDSIQADASAPALSEKVNARSEWLPIGTAPKDQGIIVAVLNTYSKTWTVGEARWQSDDPDHPDDGDWWWANISPGDYTGDSILNMNGPVEYWQPLPSPPGAELNFSNDAESDAVSLKPDTSSQPASEAGKLSSAANDVLAERERQKNVEGWTPDHDDTHASFEMARAAAFYALHTAADILPEPSSDAPSDRYGLFLTADMAWPPQWDHSTWKKPKDARRNLVRAGALLIAEIERLDRAEAKLSTDEVL